MQLLIVDDHPLIQEALQRVLPQFDKTLEAFGAANRTETLTQLYARVRARVMGFD